MKRSKLHSNSWLLITLTIATSLIPSVSNSCTCREGTPAGYADGAVYVFQAIVLESQLPSPWQSIVEGDTLRMSSSSDVAKYILEVKAVWKGEVSEHVEVYSVASSASCGVGFKIGEEYLVFAGEVKSKSPSPRTRPNGQPLTTWAGNPIFPVIYASLCGGTCLLERAEDNLNYLGKPRTPLREEEGN
jgi:hypothetical protein